MKNVNENLKFIGLGHSTDYIVIGSHLTCLCIDDNIESIFRELIITYIRKRIVYMDFSYNICFRHIEREVDGAFLVCNIDYEIFNVWGFDTIRVELIFDIADNLYISNISFIWEYGTDEGERFSNLLVR